MITKSTTMLYVADTEAALQFWTEQVGFVLVDQAQQERTSSYEIAPNKESAISFGLHNNCLLYTSSCHHRFSLYHVQLKRFYL